MSLLQQIFGGRADRQRLDPLYQAIVAAARDPGWYRAGGVPDTLNGRFDMVAALTALVLLRLEREPEAKTELVRLTELFVDDMEGTVRQIGVGDLMVGKHLGRMMGALGGRLEAMRGAESLEGAARRNIFHDKPPSNAALAWVAAGLERFRARVDAKALPALLAGEIAA